MRRADSRRAFSEQPALGAGTHTYCPTRDPLGRVGSHSHLLLPSQLQSNAPSSRQPCLWWQVAVGVGGACLTWGRMPVDAFSSQDAQAQDFLRPQLDNFSPLRSGTSGASFKGHLLSHCFAPGAGSPRPRA